MNRVVECRCGLQFFDSRGHDLCGRCRRHEAEMQAKIHAFKRDYANRRDIGLNFKILAGRRYGLSLRKIGEALGISVDVVELEYDLILQDAR